MKPKMNVVTTLTGLTIILTILLSACGASATPSPTPDVSVFYTQAAATIMAGLTQTAVSMPSATLPAATSTPEPSATPTENTTPAAPVIVNTLAPTAPPALATPILTVDPNAAHGCYNASLVADVTIRYAPAFNPGDHFTKTWRVKNTGSCDWPRGFQIAFVSGDRFGADTTVIDQKVLTGATADISLDMTAPYSFGVVNSNWMLSTDIGKTFGQVLSVAITLPGVPTGGGTTTSGGCLNSLLVSDETIPTGTVLSPNESFTKTWLVKNTGTCDWSGSFKITYVGGDLFGSDTTKIRKIVGAGSSAEISLDMKAPGTKGTVSSAWQMADDGGQLFGQLFAFSIVVK